MTTIEHGSQLAWPCHVACWLPTLPTRNEKPTTLAAAKTPAAGNWLTSASKNGEMITIEVLRDAPPLLKILCEGGRSLVSSPLSSLTFSFALVREVLLVASLIDPSGSSTYTLGCRFMCHQHAVECAAVMKAAVSAAPPKTTRPRQQLQPSSFSGQQQRAELLLLETILNGDPESAGAAWWRDFPQLVDEIGQKMRRKIQPPQQQQQQAAF
jgi:hypothetical protein